MARETWTDERLDDFKGQMNERFGHVDQHFVQVETTMKEGFARVDGDIRELRGDIKGMKRLMIQGFVGICTLMGTGFAITVTGIGILAL
jgi:hypothetical protein